jgi:hypothetical protein
MFSQVVLDSGKNALVSCIFDGKSDLMDVVYVRTSTAEETIVDLRTPSIPLGALSAKSVPVVPCCLLQHEAHGRYNLYPVLSIP